MALDFSKGNVLVDSPEVLDFSAGNTLVEDAPIKKESSFIDSIGDGMNAIRDFMTGAGPQKSSVLQGMQMYILVL